MSDSNKRKTRDLSKTVISPQKTITVRTIIEESLYDLTRTAHRKKMHLDIIRHYGGRCIDCKTPDKTVLTVQHIQKNKRPSGLALYKWIVANDYPVGFAVLCVDCMESRLRPEAIAASVTAFVPPPEIRVPLPPKNTTSLEQIWRDLYHKDFRFTESFSFDSKRKFL